MRMVMQPDAFEEGGCMAAVPNALALSNRKRKWRRRGESGGWRLKVVEKMRKRWKERARVKCKSISDEIEKLLNCTPMH